MQAVDKRTKWKMKGQGDHLVPSAIGLQDWQLGVVSASADGEIKYREGKLLVTASFSATMRGNATNRFQSGGELLELNFTLGLSCQ